MASFPLPATVTRAAKVASGKPRVSGGRWQVALPSSGCSGSRGLGQRTAEA